MIENEDIFDFINDEEKLDLLKDVNHKLNIDKFIHNKLVFVYSAPKVGSTTIVSSLRMFASNICSTIHIHDEEMLKVLGNINGITVNEIILYNKYLGKDVYVIDIYRSPIERKISTYFEKIGSYHFNNFDEKLNTYNIDKIINRFNKIFPYIGVGDHFIDKYNIDIPCNFDVKQKYLLVEENSIKYIKLRLKDSNEWGSILTNILGIKISIVKDYESINKPIKELYIKFKNNYKIPINFLKDILNCNYLKYYYSPEEINEYYNEWLNKSTWGFNSYTLNEYKIYEEITLENTHIDYVQSNHYIDEGCLCKACSLKRHDISIKIMNGVIVNERITHVEAKNELINKTNTSNINKLNKIKQLTKVINGLPQKRLKRGNINVGKNLTNIVKGNIFR
jgi:hypothetical protein